MKGWAIVLVYAAAIAVCLFYRTELSDWMRQSPSIVVSFAIALALLLFPVLPFKIVIGTLGYMYGPLLGAFISWTAASVASVIVFVVVRATLRERAAAYLSKFGQAERLRVLMERRPFATILAARLVPVFPQTLVNIYPAFLSIRLSTYAVASSLGKIPAMLVFAYLGDRLFADLRSAIAVLAVYGAFLAATYVGYRLWARRHTPE
ncbi:TVP38/TMEM64 family protein [Paenibacillus flagellatus]|uniref:TVP38/TMEM64 family membrane protein n=1 Tax=Paenibacillus flagellatus TaxID=2211139 RepID=A0A2V5KL85_9BACL|nr:VTT domain-containing protein [Paenibacillus flagellatus]PYI55720.1 TVP38/TMEM64 family protein [Paenibacillus flagellatus]